MLVTPRPGVGAETLLRYLREIHTAAVTLRGGGSGGAYTRLTAYIEWANNAIRYLANSVSAADLDRLVLTPGYGRLMAGVGAWTGTDINTQRAVNGLVSAELDQRVEDLDSAIKDLQRQMSRWQGYAHFVVPDTNFYLHYPEKLLEVDFGPLLNVWESPVRVVVPLVVVDELDALKLRGNSKDVKFRASYTLAVLDQVLPDPTAPGRLRAGDTEPSAPGAKLRSEIMIELFLDPPGHVRLPANDDEIVDRCVTIQALAGRDVTMLTFDTGMSMRARAAGVKARKLAHEQEQPATAR